MEDFISNMRQTIIQGGKSRKSSRSSHSKSSAGNNGSILKELRLAKDKISPIISDILSSTNKGLLKKTKYELTMKQYEDVVFASQLIKNLNHNFSCYSNRFFQNNTFIVNNVHVDYDQVKFKADKRLVIDGNIISELLELYQQLGTIIQRMVAESREEQERQDQTAPGGSATTAVASEGATGKNREKSDTGQQQQQQQQKQQSQTVIDQDQDQDQRVQERTKSKLGDSSLKTITGESQRKSAFASKPDQKFEGQPSIQKVSSSSRRGSKDVPEETPIFPAVASQTKPQSKTTTNTNGNGSGSKSRNSSTTDKNNKTISNKPCKCERVNTYCPRKCPLAKSRDEGIAPPPQRGLEFESEPLASSSREDAVQEERTTREGDEATTTTATDSNLEEERVRRGADPASTTVVAAEEGDSSSEQQQQQQQQPTDLGQGATTTTEFTEETTDGVEEGQTEDDILDEEIRKKARTVSSPSTVALKNFDVEGTYDEEYPDPMATALPSPADEYSSPASSDEQQNDDKEGPPGASTKRTCNKGVPPTSGTETTTATTDDCRCSQCSSNSDDNRETPPTPPPSAEISWQKSSENRKSKMAAKSAEITQKEKSGENRPSKISLRSAEISQQQQKSKDRKSKMSAVQMEGASSRATSKSQQQEQQLEDNKKKTVSSTKTASIANAASAPITPAERKKQLQSYSKISPEKKERLESESLVGFAKIHEKDGPSTSFMETQKSFDMRHKKIAEKSASAQADRSSSKQKRPSQTSYTEERKKLETESVSKANASKDTEESIVKRQSQSDAQKRENLEDQTRRSRGSLVGSSTKIDDREKSLEASQRKSGYSKSSQQKSRDQTFNTIQEETFNGNNNNNNNINGSQIGSTRGRSRDQTASSAGLKENISSSNRRRSDPVTVATNDISSSRKSGLSNRIGEQTQPAALDVDEANNVEVEEQLEARAYTGTVAQEVRRNYDTSGTGRVQGTSDSEGVTTSSSRRSTRSSRRRIQENNNNNNNNNNNDLDNTTGIQIMTTDSDGYDSAAVAMTAEGNTIRICSNNNADDSGADDESGVIYISIKCYSTTCTEENTTTTTDDNNVMATAVIDSDNYVCLNDCKDYCSSGQESHCHIRLDGRPVTVKVNQDRIDSERVFCINAESPDDDQETIKIIIKKCPECCSTLIASSTKIEEEQEYDNNVATTEDEDVAKYYLNSEPEETTNFKSGGKDQLYTEQSKRLSQSDNGAIDGIDEYGPDNNNIGSGESPSSAEENVPPEVTTTTTFDTDLDQQQFQQQDDGEDDMTTSSRIKMRYAKADSHESVTLHGIAPNGADDAGSRETMFSTSTAGSGTGSAGKMNVIVNPENLSKSLIQFESEGETAAKDLAPSSDNETDQPQQEPEEIQVVDEDLEEDKTPQDTSDFTEGLPSDRKSITSTEDTRQPSNVQKAYSKQPSVRLVEDSNKEDQDYENVPDEGESSGVDAPLAESTRVETEAEESSGNALKSTSPRSSAPSAGLPSGAPPQQRRQSIQSNRDVATPTRAASSPRRTSFEQDKPMVAPPEPSQYDPSTTAGSNNINRGFSRTMSSGSAKPKAKQKLSISLTRAKICSSMEIDVTKAETKLREKQMEHPNRTILVQLKDLGVDNLLRASRPAKCCRKALLNERQRTSLPYSVSLKSLHLSDEDVEIIKQSIEMSGKKSQKNNNNSIKNNNKNNNNNNNNNKVVVSQDQRDRLAYYVSLGQPDFTSSINFPWVIPSYDIKYVKFDRFVKIDEKSRNETTQRSSRGNKNLFDREQQQQEQKPKFVLKPLPKARQDPNNNNNCGCRYKLQIPSQNKQQNNNNFNGYSNNNNNDNKNSNNKKKIGARTRPADRASGDSPYNNFNGNFEKSDKIKYCLRTSTTNNNNNNRRHDFDRSERGFQDGGLRSGHHAKYSGKMRTTMKCTTTTTTTSANSDEGRQFGSKENLEFFEEQSSLSSDGKLFRQKQVFLYVKLKKAIDRKSGNQEKLLENGKSAKGLATTRETGDGLENHLKSILKNLVTHPRKSASSYCDVNSPLYEFFKYYINLAQTTPDDLEWNNKKWTNTVDGNLVLENGKNKKLSSRGVVAIEEKENRPVPTDETIVKKEDSISSAKPDDSVNRKKMCLVLRYGPAKNSNADYSNNNENNDNKNESNNNDNNCESAENKRVTTFCLCDHNKMEKTGTIYSSDEISDSTTAAINSKRCSISDLKQGFCGRKQDFERNHQLAILRSYGRNKDPRSMKSTQTSFPPSGQSSKHFDSGAVTNNKKRHLNSDRNSSRDCARFAGKFSENDCYNRNSSSTSQMKSKSTGSISALGGVPIGGRVCDSKMSNVNCHSLWRQKSSTATTLQESFDDNCSMSTLSKTVRTVLADRATREVTSDRMTGDRMTNERTSDRVTSDRMTRDMMTSDRTTRDRMTSDRTTRDRMTSDRVTSDRKTCDRMTSTGGILIENSQFSNEKLKSLMRNSTTISVGNSNQTIEDYSTTSASDSQNNNLRINVPLMETTQISNSRERVIRVKVQKMTRRQLDEYMKKKR